MAYKQKGWSPFTKLDDKNTQVKIKKFISDNMNKMSDVDLMKKVRKMSDNTTEYNWNNKTGEVEAHDSPLDQKASWTMEYTGNDGNKVTKEEFFKQQQENEKQRRLNKLAEQAKKNK
tara:strand:- start:210 stop:560 length:351 start_codon:yes stop_codon:yes gene_type:complete